VTVKVAAVVLAAGRSRRMGAVNKLMAEIDGVAMIVRVVETLEKSRVGAIVIVTGHEAGRIRAALAECPRARTVVNSAYEAGLSTSLAAGVAAARAGDVELDGVLIALGDMPWVERATIDALLAELEGRPGTIVAPVHEGRRGNPVLWARRYFDALENMSGDTGARPLLRAHADALRRVHVTDAGVLRDVDTPEMLSQERS
jgi:molybdenum cofactor cytidylyltransferase